MSRELNTTESLAVKLINEIGGLAAFEVAIREVIGNTNYNVLMQRRHQLLSHIVKEVTKPLAMTGPDFTLGDAVAQAAKEAES